MSVKKISDAGGSTLTVVELNGRLYPSFAMEALRGFSDFKARHDDVVVCAYPKSGTHWVWEIVRLLLHGTTELPDEEKDVGMLEASLTQELDARESPRTLNSHLHFECLPQELSSKKVKLIYVSRDPRDVGVSYFHHHNKLVHLYSYEGEWKNYFSLFKQGKVDYDSWFAYTKGWEQGMKSNPHLPIHVTSYEALRQNTETEIRRIADFIGVDPDDRFIGQVVMKSSFEVMRKAKGKYDMCIKTGSPIMYRKGKVGDWKNWFTVAQSESFNDKFEQEMQGTDAYQLYSHTVQTQSDKQMNGDP